MRQRLIAGNWKMNKTPGETETFVQAFLETIPVSPTPEILIIPPYTSLDRAGRLLRDAPVNLGAQDIHFEPAGAYTAAISAEMVQACGCRYVLAGHSERRHVFGDDDATVARKLHAILRAGLVPILCVGETLEEHKASETEAVLVRQLSRGLRDIAAQAMAGIVIAYEPVWAIGTGETATPDQAQNAIRAVRTWLKDRFDEPTAQATRILYGGSVKPANTAQLVSQPDIDGALVGGASLDPASFAAIVEEASQPQ